MVLQEATKENQNKGIKKNCKKRGLWNTLTLFWQEKTAVKETADNAKRLVRNQT